MAYYTGAAPTVAQQIANYPGSHSSFNAYQPGVKKEEEKEEEKPQSYIPRVAPNFKETVASASSAVPRSATQQTQQQQTQQQPQQQQKPKSPASAAGSVAGMGAGYYLNEALSTPAVAAPAVQVPSVIESAGATTAPIGFEGVNAVTTSYPSVFAPGVSSTLPGYNTVAAGSQAPAGFEGVATMADGSTAVAPSAAAAGYGTWAGLGTETVGSATAGQLGGAAVAVAGTYVAIHQGKQLMQEMKTGDMTGSIVHGAAAGAGAGAAVGSIWGPPGAAVGAAIGSHIGAAIGAIGASKTGKDKDQLNRDAVRDALQNGKLLDDKYNITLADGSKFDLGKDGHAKNFDGTGYAYQVARENPFSVQAVGWGDAISTVVMAGDKKLSTDFTGYFANAAMSNARDIETVRANFLTFIKDAGLTRQQIEEGLKKLKESGALDEKTFAAHVNSVATLFDGKGYVIMPWSEAEKQFGNGEVTDQNPASVPAPHPDAPDRQEGPLINDLDTQKIPPDLVLRLSGLYNYYDTSKAKAATQPSIANSMVQTASQMAQLPPRAAPAQIPAPLQIEGPLPAAGTTFPGPVPIKTPVNITVPQAPLSYQTGGNPLFNRARG